jgi:glycerate dehydrogenase
MIILDSYTTDEGDPRWWDGLRAIGPCTVHARTTTAELPARLADAEVVFTNKVRLDAAAIAAAPRLRYISLMATGTNAVDLDAAQARGIVVSNVPGYSTESVAQLVFAFLLHAANDVAGHSATVKAGRWAAGPDFTFWLRPMPELAGKTLVVVGQGAIGGAVARIGRAFGMEVIAAQVPGSATPGRVPLAEALPRAHAVTLHCPLTPATRQLANSAFFAALRPGAILINTGRGGLVDEAALIAALASGQLGGAGLDVLTDEPPAANHPLLDPQAPWASRVTITPHLAWATIEARQRLTRILEANLRCFLAGAPQNRVA